MDEKVTKPTKETVLERMAGMEERLNQRTDAGGRLNQGMSLMEERLNQRTDAVKGRFNQRMGLMEERLNQRMGEMEERISQRGNAMEERLESRADRIESDSKRTRGEMLELRADFRELNIKLKEHFPELR